jgi:hypothetical protein
VTNAGPICSVRRAVSADWPAIWSIIQAVVRSGDTYTLEPEVSEIDARQYWVDSVLATYVAEANGEIVGTVPRAFRHRGLGYVDIHVMHRFL